MSVWVYLITNRVNGKQYVGITKRTLRRRFRRHVVDATNGSDFALHRAISKYGESEFEVSVIAEVDTWEEACAREIDEIRERSTKRPGGYNLTDGGDGVLGLECSEETRAKIARSKTGKSRSLETRAKVSAARKGKKASAETRAKMSMSQKAKAPVSDETRAKIAAAATGRKLSEETKAKISAARSEYCRRKREEKAALESEGLDRTAGLVVECEVE